MPGQLSAWLAANKTEAVGVGAVAVAGLALLARKRNGTAATGVTAGAVAPGTIPAGSVVTGAAADSSAFDAYNALQDEIGTLARNSDAARNTGAGGSGVGAAVGPPVASTLLAPVGTGHYVQNLNGSIAEVESDGSLYAVQPGEWQPYYDTGSRPAAIVGNNLAMYSIGQNLAARQKASTSPAADAAATSGA